MSVTAPAPHTAFWDSKDVQLFLFKTAAVPILEALQTFNFTRHALAFCHDVERMGAVEAARQLWGTIEAGTTHAKNDDEQMTHLSEAAKRAGEILDDVKARGKWTPACGSFADSLKAIKKPLSQAKAVHACKPLVHRLKSLPPAEVQKMAIVNLSALPRKSWPKDRVKGVPSMYIRTRGACRHGSRLCRGRPTAWRPSRTRCSA
jgi:hypothetical protein